MYQNKINQESGRSMVEMLGVLAIIGVLSVGGISGYTTAMNKHKANEILNAATLRAMAVATQIQSGSTTPTLGEFDNENEVGGAKFSSTVLNADGTAAWTPSDTQFKIGFVTGSEPSPAVLAQMANIVGDGSIVKSLDGGLTYNNDLDTGTSGDNTPTITCPFGYIVSDGNCIEGPEYIAECTPQNVGQPCHDGQGVCRYEGYVRVCCPLNKTKLFGNNPYDGYVCCESEDENDICCQLAHTSPGTRKADSGAKYQINSSGKCSMKYAEQEFLHSDEDIAEAGAELGGSCIFTDPISMKSRNFKTLDTTIVNHLCQKAIGKRAGMILPYGLIYKSLSVMQTGPCSFHCGPVDYCQCENEACSNCE